jgi:hypothetical protein
MCYFKSSFNKYADRCALWSCSTASCRQLNVVASLLGALLQQPLT